MSIVGFPPEEGIISDWLLKELGEADSWERIRVVMRALANVRRLGEAERAINKVQAAPVIPVPFIPPREREAPKPRIMQSELFDEAEGAPWEADELTS